MEKINKSLQLIQIKEFLVKMAVKLLAMTFTIIFHICKKFLPIDEIREADFSSMKALQKLNKFPPIEEILFTSGFIYSFLC